MNTLVITIVNWNGKEMLATCLDSVLAQTYTDYSLLLVDNGSTDGSVEFIKTHYPDIDLIEFDHNTGFAYPHTYAIKQALTDPNVRYILTLNNDTKLDNTFLEKMVAAAERHAQDRVGAIQGKVVNFYDRTLIDCTGVLIHWDMSALNRGKDERDHGQYDSEEEIFGPSASAALYTREALESVQLPDGDFFDSSYFAYYEDVDLAWRMRLQGFSAWYTPHAVITHIHSATGVSHSPFKAFHIHRNHFYNMIKNLPGLMLLRALLFLPVRYVLLLTSVLRNKGAAAELKKRLVQEPQENMVRLVFRSWKEVIVVLPQLLKKRHAIQANRAVGLQTIQQWLHTFHASLKKIIYG